MWASSNRGISQGLIPGRKTLGPLFLMIACPITVFALSSLHQDFGGDISLATRTISRPRDYTSPTLAVVSFALFAILLLKTLPPLTYVKGPLTPAGLHATYVDNGIQSFFFTLVVFVTCSDLGPLALYPIDVWVLHLTELFTVTNVVSFALCTWLVVRTYYSPHSRDYSTQRNIIADYYVGRELHPTFLSGIDVKQFTNCRFGVMLWPVMCISAVGHEYKRFNGAVSNATWVSFGLQMLYLTQFYLWEKAYFSTIDMMHDRAGFYLCWGCINWVPCLYANVSIFLAWAPHSEDMGTTPALCLFAAGVFFLFLRCHADLQRTRFRLAGDKVFYVFGKPAEFIVAPYKTEDGKQYSNKLLVSGYWGKTRHFNYLAELLFSYSWALPTAYVGLGVNGLIVGMFYSVFLTVLLIDRCYRDDARCSSKYGQKWAEYTARVPYRLIPYVF